MTTARGTSPTLSLCQSIDTLAMAYLDDELADEELRDFELHLADCAACRERVDADAEALSDLRRQLAAPPAPDVLRARLGAALDAEDAATAREERRHRLAGWALPGAASVAAVAAIALFVVSQVPEERRDPLDAVGAPIRAVELPVGPQPVAGGGATPISPRADLVASWHEEKAGKDTVVQLYRVVNGYGFEAPVYARIFDARGLDVGDARPITENGRHLGLWLVERPGAYFVVHKTDGGVGYAFSSEVLGPTELVRVILRYGMVDRIDARIRREP